MGVGKVDIDGECAKSCKRIKGVSEWRGRFSPALKCESRLRLEGEILRPDFTFCQARPAYTSEEFLNEMTYLFLQQRP